MDLAHELLNKTQKRALEAYSMLPLGYWELDAKSMKIELSNKACDIIGVPHGTQGDMELLGTLLSQKDFQKFKNSINKCLKTGKECHLAYKILRQKDAPDRWVECHAKREIDPQTGESISIYGTIQDITKNIHIDRQMQDVRSLLRILRNVNKLLLKAKNSHEFLDDICKEIGTLEAIKGVWIIPSYTNKHKWHSYGFGKKHHKIMLQNVKSGLLPECYKDQDTTIVPYGKNPQRCEECIVKKTLSLETDFSTGLWCDGKHYGRMGFITHYNEKDDPYISELLIQLGKDIAFSLKKFKFIENSKVIEKLHAAIFDSALSGIFIHDDQGQLIDVNPAIERLNDAPKEEILKQKVCDFYPKGHEGLAKSHYNILMRDGYLHAKTLLQTIKGKEFYAEVFLSLVEIDGKKLVQGMLNDITDLHEADKQMRQYEAIALSTKEGICVTDANARIEYVNDSFSTITGYSLDELKGCNPSALKSGKHDRVFYKQMWESIANEGIWQGEIWNRKKTGQIYPEYITIRKIEDSLGRIEGYIAVFSDLSVKKLNQRKIDFLSTHDPLTKLPNRQNTKEKLDHLIANTNFDNKHILVISLDIDNFKTINDSFGHSLGDKLLIAFVKRIEGITNHRATIGRLSADEFVLFQKVSSFEKSVHEIKILLDELQKSFEIEDKKINITVSMGASLAPDDGMNGEILIKNADIAMRKVKEEGKNNYTFYKDEMTRLSYERILMINALKVAIDNEDFELYYQPLQNLDSDKIIGFEALIRWKTEDLGVVAPSKFIPLAEETRLILPLGRWVIKEACRQLALWRDDQLKKEFTIAINISSVQLYHSNLTLILEKYISHFKINPHLLKIEITESTIMNITNEIASTLEKIKNMGISLSIDDFGTGYSSLSRLKKLPVDTLKVDRSFTIDIPQSKDACTLSKSILSIAKQMGLHIIVEGIETKEQMEFYKNEKGCILQGYYLAKPMPLYRLEKWLLNPSISTHS